MPNRTTRNPRHVYELVSHDENGEDRSPIDDKGSARQSRICWRHPIATLMITVTGFVIVGFAIKMMFHHVKAVNAAATKCDDVSKGYYCQPNISHYWGQYSPYFSVQSEIPTEVPETCQITFVQVLSRHGGRDPTLSKTVAYNETIQRIKKNVPKFRGPYAFLKNYVYQLGADELTVFGQQQMINSGIQFYDRYQNLTRVNTPFFRASDSNRVVISGENFTQGFHQARLADKTAESPSSLPYSITTISEVFNSNNTLNNKLCTEFTTGQYSTIGTAAQQIWLDIFATPIAKRLNADLPGAFLSASDTIYIMDMCPFETIATPSGQISAFCALFTELEWQQYDYFESLGKYYGHGDGNPMGSTQGVGFANELIARMTNQPVVDHTSVNHTLDNANNTFPINTSQMLFADFSHDNDMSSIFSALGLFNATTPLSNTTMQSSQLTNGYSASWTVPFAARAYFEKMSCANSTEELVRVVLNGRVLPLEFCGADELGRCGLGAFVDNLGFARAGGMWEKCFV